MTKFTDDEMTAAYELYVERRGGWIPDSLIRERARSKKPKVIVTPPTKPTVTLVMPKPVIKLVF